MQWRHGPGLVEVGSRGVCTYVAKLDVIANTVAAADVHDPDTFKKTMAAAVHDYVTNLHALRAVAPPELGAGLDRVEADVKQFRFDAALTDRAALDSYVAQYVWSGAPVADDDDRLIAARDARADDHRRR